MWRKLKAFDNSSEIAQSSFRRKVEAEVSRERARVPLVCYNCSLSPRSFLGDSCKRLGASWINPAETTQYLRDGCKERHLAIHFTPEFMASARLCDEFWLLFFLFAQRTLARGRPTLVIRKFMRYIFGKSSSSLSHTRIIISVIINSDFLRHLETLRCVPEGWLCEALISLQPMSTFSDSQAAVEEREQQSPISL